jgi:dTDP-glucose pyrophosphorylase
LRNEIEITDVIQNMVNEGEEISPVMFDGTYINMTSPEDIKEAEMRIK